ncbi:hypothetical protein U8P80_17495 [Rhizobium beringeri]|jgi:hypothetical protein|uniref:hypothetical protein n=1 Tax=Rhizobium TaxID=379 RepID=UPI00102FD3B2|nr:MULTISPECIES: hypothetical protein [Rhizobium]TBD05755.1 hypothetical protein ELH21_15715 [Rhizobium leguminosarum]UIJ78505.1 hypothetical protein LZK78_17135 [Rhizobium leguminosarum]WSG73285.1 hypothetical protein U8P80_17495 [Rhizobium beringeri]WSG87783.1 hypothetical protein U8P73_17355 [Rhizobium beringeri]WSH13480.1 hypothetical protein U8P74_17495 [Rhizobium beringeri]
MGILVEQIKNQKEAQVPQGIVTVAPSNTPNCRIVYADAIGILPIVHTRAEATLVVAASAGEGVFSQ